jgi:hypothetical protein
MILLELIWLENIYKWVLHDQDVMLIMLVKQNMIIFKQKWFEAKNNDLYKEMATKHQRANRTELFRFEFGSVRFD